MSASHLAARLLDLVKITALPTDIPCLRQNPKFFVSDDPEAIPLVGQGLPKELQDRICELLLRGVVVIVGDALVHDGP